MPTREELLALMKAGPKSKEVTVDVQDKIPEIKDEVTTRVTKMTTVALDDNASVLQLLESINSQAIRTNSLLTQIRNNLMNRPSDWKLPEEEVTNGEIT